MCFFLILWPSYYYWFCDPPVTLLLKMPRSVHPSSKSTFWHAFDPFLGWTDDIHASLLSRRRNIDKLKNSRKSLFRQRFQNNTVSFHMRNQSMSSKCKAYNRVDNRYIEQLLQEWETKRQIWTGSLNSVRYNQLTHVGRQSPDCMSAMRWPTWSCVGQHADRWRPANSIGQLVVDQCTANARLFSVKVTTIIFHTHNYALWLDELLKEKQWELSMLWHVVLCMWCKFPTQIKTVPILL